MKVMLKHKKNRSGYFLGGGHIGGILAQKMPIPWLNIFLEMCTKVDQKNILEEVRLDHQPGLCPVEKWPTWVKAANLIFVLLINVYFCLNIWLNIFLEMCTKVDQKNILEEVRLDHQPGLCPVEKWPSWVKAANLIFVLLINVYFCLNFLYNKRH